MIWQLALYELLEIIPCALLVVAPFSAQLHSKRTLWMAILVLCCVGVVRRYVVMQEPSLSAALAVLWIFLYLAAWSRVLTISAAKFLFILILVLNYASLVAVVYHYVGLRFFGAPLESAPYCWQASLSLALVWIPAFPVLYVWLSQRVSAILSAEENSAMWRFLWLVPTIFCVIFYYNLYADGGILAYSRQVKNLLFTVVISVGSFFVTMLTLRLVRESNLALFLQSQNHHLSLHALQHEYLQERIEEACHARHDLRQVTAVMQSFLQNGDTEALYSYVQHCCATVPKSLPFIQCSHPVLDTLLGYYSEQAAQQEIRFAVKTVSLQTVNIKDMDLVVLFGNLLENAVEACKRQAAGERYIRLTIQRKAETILLSVRNSCDRPMLREPEGIRSSKRSGFGVGLASVERIVKLYQGTVRFACDGHEFHVLLLLQLPR